MTDSFDDMPSKHSNIPACVYITKAFFKYEPFTVQDLQEKILSHNLWRVDRQGETEEDPVIIYSSGKVVVATLRSLLWTLKTRNLLAESQGRGIYRLNCQEADTFLEQFSHFPQMDTWVKTVHDTPQRAATTLLTLRRRSIHHAATEEQNDGHTSMHI